jgi:hypothetical protein
MSTIKQSLVLCQLLMGTALAHAQNAPAPAPVPAAETSIPGASKQSKAAAAPAAKPAAVTPAPAPAKPAVAAPAAAKPAAPATPPVKPEEAKKAPIVAPAPAAPPAETAKAAPESSKKESVPPKKPDASPVCSVAEFRALAMETRDGELRRSKVLEWVKQKGKFCSAEKLLAIRNNRSQWMGQADSTIIAGAIDGLLEVYAEGNPSVLNYLYGTQPPAPKPPEEKKSAPPK